MYFVLKVAGSALVTIGSLLAGRKVKMQYKKRCEILKQMQEALKYADDTIAIENTLLDNVLRDCGEKFFKKEKGKDVWTCAAENLKTEFGSFENAWDKACNEFFEDEVCLNEKDKECIRNIGKAIGIANTQRQTAHVTAGLQRLQTLEKEANAAETKEGNNAVKIALAIAAVVIIVLF
ncbi:MAG: hypothetical protein E7387_02110 [Ruminococcaceae bacterium]|nr:hypothetical protein [Oscillospiraceae bacterium]